MIIDLHEKYDVTPEWFKNKVKQALTIADATIVEKLTLPRLCELLTVYKVKDETGAEEAANRMQAIINSKLIEAAME